MKSVRWILNKRHYVYVVGLVLAGGLLLTGGSNSQQISAQSADSIYLTPATGTYTVGNTFTVTIRENSSTAVNAAQADLGYSSNLEFVSIDGAGSAFGIDASSTGGGGSVSISRGNIAAVSGDQLISKVTFKVIGAGAASITMLPSSEVLSSTTNQNVATTRNGGSYTAAGAATPSPTPTPTPAATPTSPTPTPTPTTKPSASSATASAPKSQAATTIASQGSATATPLPGDSKVELKAPATVDAVPVDGKPVTKVEFLINNKVVSTDTTPPYSQSIDSDNMRNGTYSLTTKTYYKDGTIDSSVASFVVRNPLDVKQVLLQLKHFAWLIIILLIIAGELVYLKFFKNRPHGNLPGSGGINAASGHGNVVIGGSSGGTAVQPAVISPFSGNGPSAPAGQPKA